MLTEEQRLQIVTRLALIQSLPVGHYNDKAFCELNTGDTCSLRKGSDKIEGKRECPICMNDFLPGQSIRLLPCMHFYHIHCIDDWLMRALTCPTCIQRVDSFNHHPIRRNSLYRRSSSDSSSTTNYSNSSSTERLTELSSTQHVTAEVY
jgi:E3 ubiquitin-protein ligase RNF11